jgi:L-fucose mutarotase
MLKGIDPVLAPDLLAMLREMGHGDEIVIADSNFPAATNARRLVRLDGVTGPRLVRAVLSVLPLDDFVPDAAFRMAVVDDPTSVPPICEEYAALLADVGYKKKIAPMERMAFYARAREAFGIVATGETRIYANLILTKGVIKPEGR